MIYLWRVFLFLVFCWFTLILPNELSVSNFKTKHKFPYFQVLNLNAINWSSAQYEDWDWVLNVLSDIFLIDFFLSLICNKTASIRDKLWSIIDMQWWNEGSSWGEIDQQRNIWSKACVLERQIFFTWGS